MSSTNKTTNYELSQFIGTDKPAWLSDYNGDMGKIDAQMKLNADAASTADGKAVTNTTAIGTLANLTTDAKTNLVAAINEVDLHADSAQSVATDANTLAGTANTTANGLATFLTLNTFADSTLSCSSNINASVSRTIRSAVNSDGSLGKVYGSAYFSKKAGATGSAWIKVTSGLRPTSEITVTGFAIANGATGLLASESVTIATNGDITFTIADISTYDTNNHALIFPACLIFASDFGD